MSAELLIAIGELRGELRGINKRLDSQDEVIGRIDDRTRRLEHKNVGDEAVEVAAEKRTRTWREMIGQAIHALINPLSGAVAGGLVGHYWR